MKKLALTFLVLVGVAHANSIDESRTDIYFGNGVWNSAKDAEDNRKALEIKINKHIIKNNPKLKRRYGDVKLAYNWNRGYANDLLEAYVQLRDSGQINAGITHFFEIMTALADGKPGAAISATLRAIFLMKIVEEEEQANVDEMWRNYYDDSLSLSHRVLLISHSQGGLFANRIYKKVRAKGYGNYFANIQVGSPAKNIEAKDNFRVALWGDPVVKISGITQGNIQGSGHSFIEAYLANEEALNKIIFGTKHLLKTLDTYSSQWETKEIKNENTKDYRVTLEHSFDKSVLLFDDVYPFNLSGYVYKVPLSTTGGYEYVKGSFLGDKILDADVDEWENKQDYQFYKLDGVNPPEYIEGELFVYIVKYRPWMDISSMVFSMCGRGKCVRLDKELAQINVYDGPFGSPTQGTYDPLLDSKWAGTKYEGILGDAVLAVVPFEKEKGWLCDNPEGACNDSWRNFKTYYSLQYNDYLKTIYKENFLNPTEYKTYKEFKSIKYNVLDSNESY